MEITAQKLSRQALLTSFNGTIAELIQRLSSVDEKKFNRVPFEGSWTAGQLGEHLLMSATAITGILNGDSRPTERSADENVKSIETMMLDFTQKSKSAPQVTPTSGRKEKEKLIGELKTKMEEIRAVVETDDLSVTCVDFPFPGLGELTRWEWISFLIYHTKRHIHQLDNIIEAIK